MTAPLQTSWQLKSASGEPPAVIRVRNLQATVQGPDDAWGRPGRPQPILVSAEVSLYEPFGSSSATDVVASDTVHYGLLSKSIIGTLNRLAMGTAGDKYMSLYLILNTIWSDLTGLNLLGLVADLDDRDAFLDMTAVRCLNVSIDLPKASLLGSGVGLSATTLYHKQDAGAYVEARAMSLHLKELKVPTLIGVNSNERTAKQVVLANICIEKYGHKMDAYPALEAVVVETMSKSSYETLEALASDLASRIAKHLKKTHLDNVPESGWGLAIGLEKPTAVVLADAACVELRVSTNDIIVSL